MRLPFCIAISLALISSCSEQGSTPEGSLAELERSLAAARAEGRLFGEIDRSAVSASLVAIIAAPDAYHGRRIRTYGVANFKFEGNGLFLSKEHWEYGIRQNALWITPAIPNVSEEELEALNGKYVLVEGIVNAQQSGHLGLYTAEINDVNRVLLLERE